MTETIKDQTGQLQQMIDSKEHETALKLLATNTKESLISTHYEEPMDHLNPQRVKMFLPLKQRSGGLFQYIKDRNGIYLTTDQARYIYKKVEKVV